MRVALVLFTESAFKHNPLTDVMFIVGNGLLPGITFSFRVVQPNDPHPLRLSIDVSCFFPLSLESIETHNCRIVVWLLAF